MRYMAERKAALRWNKGGMKYFPQRLDRAAQNALLAALRRVIAEAPLFTPTMPRSGNPMSVRMTNCGPLGWVTDTERGYRYQETHPETGKPWPAIPQMLLDLWDGVADYPCPPEACLVNYYIGSAKMGLHQDKDEEDFDAPVDSEIQECWWDDARRADRRSGSDRAVHEDL